MTALALAATALLVALNAFFVLAEYSLIRARRHRLEAMKDEGLRGAALAVKMLDDLGAYISAAQVGVTMTSIGIGALGEPALARAIEDLFGTRPSHGVTLVLSVLIAYLIITSVHIVFGEIVPKLYSIPHAEGVARRVAQPFEFFKRMVTPLSWMLTRVANRILRLLNVDPKQVREQEQTPEELRSIISESGTLDPGEAGMLVGVFHLHEQESRQVMTPIPAVLTVDTSEDVETALRRCVSSGHTRLLATEDHNKDRVRGIVHTNSLAQLLLAEGHNASIEAVIVDAPIVPETKPLDDLLADLQRQRSTMAVVIDEYGRVAGIVTVEDIIEEVVGEISDETDPAGGEVRRLA